MQLLRFYGVSLVLNEAGFNGIEKGRDFRVDMISETVRLDED